MKLSIANPLIVGVWLSGTLSFRLAYHFISHGNKYPIYAFLISLIWPLFIFFFFGLRLKINNLNIIECLLLVIFFVFSLISCSISPFPLLSIGHLLATMSGVYLASIISRYLSDDELRISLKIYASILTLSLMYITFVEIYQYGASRLGQQTDFLNPNSIAMIAMSVILCGFAFENSALLFSSQLTGIVAIYYTGSRAAALGALVAITMGFYRIFANFNLRQKIIYFLILITVVPLFISLEYEFIITTLNKFFLWDDPHRGLESGMSGRFYTWKQILDVIYDNLIFGVGFRSHGHHVLASSAHNGYLAMIADIGIFGSFAIFCFIVYRQYKLFFTWLNDNKSIVINILFPLSVGYLLVAIFERYLINVGNPTSLLFLIALLRNSRRDTI